MTKRQARKTGHKYIFTEGKSHQETFDSLRDKVEISAEELAKILSQIPSKYLYEKTRNLWTTFIGFLGIIIVFRIAAIFLLLSESFGNSPEILLLIAALGVLFPIWGIVGTFKGQTHVITMVPVLLALSYLRGISKMIGQMSMADTIYPIFLVGLSVTAYMIYKQWKTPYQTRTVIIDENAEVKKKRLEFTFEEHEKVQDDLLDSSL